MTSSAALARAKSDARETRVLGSDRAAAISSQTKQQVITVGLYGTGCYLHEHGVDDGVADGGEGGRDDAEAERLERAAHLGHGVPAPAEQHAEHRNLVPGLRDLHLRVSCRIN
jgi:hypothetical protein